MDNKTNRTELVFILDRSGSMSGLESDTIGGYNSMLKKQKEVEGECRITTVLFDNNYELLHDRIDIRAVSPITDREYYVGGSTALIDAIGITINKIVNVQRSTAEEFRADKVMFVIITDGYENASREYTADQVKKMVKTEQEKYGWEFVFLGANIDSVETASHFGISADRAVNYVPDGEGTRLNYGAVSAGIAMMRETGTFDDSCLADVREDFKKRGRRR